MPGRNTVWSEELEAKAQEYIDGGWQDQGDAVPMVVGLCKYIQTPKSTIYDWAKDENRSFSDIVKQINENQELELVNKTLRKDYDSKIGGMMLSKHGYAEKQEVAQDITTGGKPVNNWTVNPVTTNKDG